MRLRLGSCSVDLDQGEVHQGDLVVRLGDSEVRLLRKLAQHSHETVDHEELIASVWPDGQGSARGLQRLVARVRSKIEEDPTKPSLLLTLRRVGYRMVPSEVHRATPQDTGGVFRVGGTRVDLRQGMVHRSGQTFPLTKTERRLLAYLDARAGSYVSTEELLREVWQYRTGVQTRTLDTTLSRLRVKLEEDPSSPKMLLRKRDRGVQLLRSTPVPAQQERSFGRAAMVRDLAHAFGCSRLLVLHGPGGIGKSHLVRRLLLERRDAPEVEGGCWWVALGGARTLDEALRRVGRSLRCAGHVGDVERDITRLGEHIAQQRPCVVVLDAIEGVHDPLMRAVVRWMELASQAMFIVASRTATAPRGAIVCPVTPLESEAARALLVQHMADLGTRGLHPDRVRALVEASEGIPLALELLGSRAARFGEGGPALLAMEQHSDESRLASLRANIGVSWHLCSEDEISTLALLATFSGPVARTTLAELVDEADTHMVRLTAASLVHVRPAPESGLYLFDAVKEYAREEPAWRGATLRHAHWVVERGLELERISLSDHPANVDRCIEDWAPELRRALERNCMDPLRAASLFLAVADLLAQRHMNSLRALVSVVAAHPNLRDHPDLVATAFAAERLRIWPAPLDWDATHRWARAQTNARLVRWSHHLALFQHNWANRRVEGLAVTEAGLRRLMELGSFQEHLSLLVQHVDQLCTAGDPRGVQLLQQALQPNPAQSGRIPPLWRAHLLYRLANLHRKAGCFRSARLQASRSVSAFQQLGLDTLQFNPRRLQALCALHLEDVDEARTALGKALELLPHGGHGASAAFAHRLVALLAFDDDDPQAALTALERSDEAATAGGAGQVLSFNNALRAVAFHLMGAVAAARTTYGVAWDNANGILSPQSRGVMAAWASLAFEGTPEESVWRERLDEAAALDWQAQQARALVGGPAAVMASPENTSSCYLRLTERLVARTP